VHTIEESARRRRGVGAPAGPAGGFTLAFYAAMAAMTVVLAARWQYHVLPASLATRVGHDSEIFNIAPVVVAAVETRRRIGAFPDPRAVTVSAGVAALLLATGLFIFYGPVELTVTSVNEAAFAGAVLWLYVFLPRPLRLAWLASVALLVVIVVGYHTALVTRQAEAMVALVLAPVSFDVVDRRLLEARAPHRPRLEVAWLAFLVLLPVVLMVVKRQDLQGVWEEIVKYPSRGTEGFWGMALVHAFYLVGRPARSRQAARPLT
jgi:hypothetical protein